MEVGALETEWKGKGKERAGVCALIFVELR
jgi:hypothetical protein